MNVLVTGAAGFAGRHLLEYLLARDGSTRIVGLTRNGPPEDADSRVVWRSADITDAAATREAVRSGRPDVIYHLAGLAATTGNQEELFRANVQGTVHVLDAAARALGNSARALARRQTFAGTSPIEHDAELKAFLADLGVVSATMKSLRQSAVSAQAGDVLVELDDICLRLERAVAEISASMAEGQGAP